MVKRVAPVRRLACCEGQARQAGKQASRQAARQVVAEERLQVHLGFSGSGHRPSRERYLYGSRSHSWEGSDEGTLRDTYWFSSSSDTEVHWSVINAELHVFRCLIVNSRVSLQCFYGCYELRNIFFRFSFLREAVWKGKYRFSALNVFRSLAVVVAQLLLV